MAKEIPILFSTSMVKAILDELKDRTRRLKGLEKINENPDDWEFYGIGKETIVRTGKESIVAKFKHKKHGYYTSVKLPWWRKDILWVRENWQIRSWDFEDGMCNIKYATGEVEEFYLKDGDDNSAFTPEWLQFQLDAMAEKGIFTIVDKDEKETLDDDEIFYKRTDKPQPFKPSIHMPKEAARIWLQVEDVRVERLQDISADDAIKEGIDRLSEPSAPNGTLYKHYLKDKWGPSPKHSFETLWHSITGQESWNNNPWVWVISFKVLSTTGRPETIN